jgi:hypothetical protein
MELKSNKIKNMNDFIGGILLGAVSVFLMVSKHIVEGRLVTGKGGTFVRADTYIKMLGGLMFFLAFIMVIRSINFKRTAETKGFTFTITKESLLTIVALLIYTVVLKLMGFALTTFLFSFFIVCLYMRKENQGKELSRRQIIKKVIVAGVFSVILVGVVYVLFSKVLMVVLP